MTVHFAALHAVPAPADTEIREAVAADAEVAGRVIFDAFSRFQASRGFTPDFPSLAAATGFAAEQIADPHVFAVVAVRGDEIVGANFLSEGDAIRGIGPIAVRPDLDGGGIGRQLMYAVIARAAGARGVRLVQDAFNAKSLALYAALGFAVREPLAVLAGTPRGHAAADARVRPMTAADLAAADSLARRVLGFDRGTELRAALARGTPVVVERSRRITGYMTAPQAWDLNHGVAENEDDLKALILGAREGRVSFLLPTRHARLFHWALAQGLKVVKPMTLMTRGRYSEPKGAYMPSVLF